MEAINSTQMNTLAQKIYNQAGGYENLSAGGGHITRLKLTLLDPKKLHVEELLVGETLLLGVLDRIETDNALYIVTKPGIAEPLWQEIAKLKDQAITAANSAQQTS